MTRDHVDVIILGAGVAGLAAARDLSRAGLAVCVLEARDRIGGRVYTLHDPSLPLPVELGAEFIHGMPTDIHAIVQAAGLPIYEIDGDRWRSHEGALVPGDDRWSQVDSVLGRMEQVDEHDQSFQAFIEPYLQDEHWREAAVLATSYIEGFDAALIDRVSVRALAREQRASAENDGDRAFRVLGGYDQVARWLRAGFDPRSAALHLNTVVTEVRWRRGAVTLLAQSRLGQALEPFHATCAVVTLPLGVLRAPPDSPGSVRFSPALPEKQGAVQQLEMGQVVKITLRFRERFWGDDRFIAGRDGENLDGLSFLYSRDPWMPTWWTAHPLRAPLLTGWAGGPAAARLVGQGENFIAGQAIDALARLLGIARGPLEALLEGWYVHDWHADPFARGAYSYIAVGGLDAPQRLATPVDDALFFAGEATDSAGHTGTVHGAIASGRRAAREVIECLRR